MTRATDTTSCMSAKLVWLIAALTGLSISLGSLGAYSYAAAHNKTPRFAVFAALSVPLCLLALCVTVKLFASMEHEDWQISCQNLLPPQYRWIFQLCSRRESSTNSARPRAEEKEGISVVNPLNRV